MPNKLIQIFLSGNYGGGLVFSDMDVLCIASGYSKKKLCAPLVLGHPANNLPEYGEVDALFAEGGKLYAQANFSDELVDLITRKLFKNVSASFFRPHNAENPTPGMYYLRHVGFLGAYPPAVKGMDALNFSESMCTVEFSESHGISSKGGVVVPKGYQIDLDRQRIFNLAKDYQRVCPSLSFAEAVQRAETITTNRKGT